MPEREDRFIPGQFRGCSAGTVTGVHHRAHHRAGLCIEGHRAGLPRRHGIRQDRKIIHRQTACRHRRDKHRDPPAARQPHFPGGGVSDAKIEPLACAGRKRVHGGIDHRAFNTTAGDRALHRHVIAHHHHTSDRARR